LTSVCAMPNKNDYAIEVSNLKKCYGDLWAVNGVSFKVRRGEVLAFLGPNGAGKTTLVEMLEFIRPPTSGDIRLLGRELRSNKEYISQRIGVLPQEFKSYERLTVRETLVYFQRLYRKGEDVDKILKWVGLEDKRDTFYMHLSGGLKQRLGVGIALVNDPEIVFLDEPTTGLDPKARKDVWELISHLKKRGKTVFLTTHYMEEAEYLADNVIIIHHGKIIAQGTTEELIWKYGKSEVLTISKCNVGKVSKLLKDHDLKPWVTNSNVSARIKGKDIILEVLTSLKEKDISYDQVDIKRPSLEEVFLNLTGATLKEGKKDEA